MLDVILTILAVLGPIAVHLAHRSKTKVDDIAAAAAGDPEAQRLFKELMARLGQIKAEVEGN